MAKTTMASTKPGESNRISKPQRAPLKKNLKRTEAPAAKTKAAAAKAAGKIVGVDRLAWKAVQLPDLLEDAEGFYELEEIDDVEVVRADGSSSVQYRVATDRNLRNAGATGEHPVDAATLVDDSEWGGFGDDERPESATAPAKAKDVAPKKELIKMTKKEKQHAKGKNGSQTASKDTELRSYDKSNAFAALEGSDDETADVSAWSGLGLSAGVLTALSKLKFSRPTPIQSAAIPEITGGHDVIGKASTGSGKTLAFGIPIVEAFVSLPISQGKAATRDEAPFLALILSPTRELAHQLAKHLEDLCSGLDNLGPRIATVTGGLSLHKQQRLLGTADVVIGTPGRLWEVVSSTPGLLNRMRKIRFLVIDEADRLLSEGHFKEVEEILDSLDKAVVDEDESNNDSSPVVERQTLVFSATLQRDLQQKLAGKGKRPGADALSKYESMEYLLKKLNFREPKPKFVDVNPISQMAARLREGLVECPAMEKDLYLYALLLLHPNTRTLIFTNSISSVRRLAPYLQSLNIQAQPLHSQMQQKARLKSIERFSSPASLGAVLVATDVAARGLDVRAVQLIIHYHVPRAADMYVHRSGRTARAENSGTSILLCAPEEVVPVRRLVAKVHARNADDSSKQFFVRTLDIDRRVISRIKPRVSLAKQITDAAQAKEKVNSEDNWLRNAAEELGVDYDSEEFADQAGGGRGQGRKKKMKQASQTSKGELAVLKAQLKELLSQRVNVGVSEKYLSAGGIDVEKLLTGDHGEFLGQVNDIGFD